MNPDMHESGSKYITPALHVFFWLSGYSLVFIVAKPYFYNPAVWITVIMLFYTNVYWLIPKYLEREKNWLKYALLTSMVLTGVTILEFFLEHLFELPPVYIDGRTQKNWLEAAVLFSALTFLKGLIVLPLSFLFKFARDLIVLKKVTIFAEISLHLLIIGMLYVPSMMAPPHWAPEHEPLLFLFKAGYKFFILALQLSFFYLNAFWLIPKFLAKKRYATYFLVMILLFAASIAIEYFTYQLPVFSAEQTSALMQTINRDVFFKLAILLASILYRFSIDWFRHQDLQKKLESEKLSTELKFLQFQVHPHFLFNSLNNIYSLAMQEDSPGTARSLGKLGGMMHYMLEECQQSHVLLSKELEYLQQYIDLQQLRMVEKNKINVDMNIDENVDDFKIVPMMLIPFVENAFKHGMSMTAPSFINLKMVQLGNKFSFHISNSVQRKNGNLNGTGIGLKNVIRRLMISYPDQHTLITEEKDGEYKVHLHLTLDPA
jgi:hypothetical protein